MRAIERVADLDPDCQGLGRWQGAAAPQTLGERFAVEKLEHEEVDAVFTADIEQGADVRMLERRNRARLPLEPLAQLRVGGQRRGKHFDRDGTVEPGVARAIHLAHAPGPERRDHLIRPESDARRHRHRVGRLYGA